MTRAWAILKVVTPIIVAVVALVPPLITALKPAQAAKPTEIHMGPGSVYVEHNSGTISPISIQGWVEGFEVIKNVFVPQREPVKVSSRVEEYARSPTPSYVPPAEYGRTSRASSANATPLTPKNSEGSTESGAEQSKSTKPEADQSQTVSMSESLNVDWVVANRVGSIGPRVRQAMYSNARRAYSMLCPESPQRTSEEEFVKKRNEWEWGSYGRMGTRPLRMESLDFPIAVFQSSLSEVVRNVDSAGSQHLFANERIQVKLDSNYGFECIASIDQTLRSQREACLRAPQTDYECWRILKQR